MKKRNQLLEYSYFTIPIFIGMTIILLGMATLSFYEGRFPNIATLFFGFPIFLFYALNVQIIYRHFREKSSPSRDREKGDAGTLT